MTADNVVYSSTPSGVPSGTIVAADAVAGVHFQTVKLDIGGDGLSDPVTDIATEATQGKMRDESGALYGVKHVDNKIRTSSTPYFVDIAEGNVPDHAAVRRFGSNASVGVTWETVHHNSDLRTWLTAAERLQVTSSDAADTSAGAGARTITLSGLDDSYDEISETVTLNGVANVLTTNSYLRVQSAVVATAGATGYNEGTVTISDNADAHVLESIEIQANSSLSAVYTVPNGETFYMVQAMATEGSSKGSVFGFWVRAFGGLWTMKRTIVLLDAGLVVGMPMPMKVPAKSDIEIRSKAILAGANVSAGFQGWIES